MEAIKAVVFPREPIGTPDGHKLYKYLMAAVIVTDEPITLMNETVILDMRDTRFSPSITGLLKTMTTYKCEYPLGELTSAIMSVTEMESDDDSLELVREGTPYVHN